MRDQLISTDGGEKTQLSQTAALGNHFSSIAQLNACGNLQMTELSSWEGGKSSSKSFFVFGFDFWKTQLSPTQLGSMQEYPETHASETITHYCWN